MPPDVNSLRLYDSPPDPARLAAHELLRPPGEPRARRELEPFSRGWFEELELKRYARHGAWLPRVLEFTRHAGERLLMLGPGLGSDALQYLRHGTQVAIGTASTDHPDLIRRNFDLRGVNCEMVPVGPELPFPRGAFDLAYVNVLQAGDFAPAELFRVLKPGGKLFLLAAAHYDCDFWQDRLFPWLRLWGRAPEPMGGRKHSAQSLRASLAGFAEFRVAKRHLRRGELPHIWRGLPLPLLERLCGRVLVLRAFKPLAAAREELAAAA